ncbi:MAG: hypothetical protein ABI779_22605 [Acidobacteriota bacterium]
MRERRAYWIAFAACAIAATIPLLVTGVLPMADLPEHMAQVAIWKHFDDACQRFSDVYEIRLATPYLAGSAITAAFATVLTVSAATKATVWLCIMLLPLALRPLLRHTGADPWLSLLGFPLAFGYSFYWGFLNFLLAMAIGVFYLAVLLDERPRPIANVLFPLLLIGAHAVMFLFCASVAVLIAMVRKAPRRLLPLIPAFSFLVIFAVRLRGGEPLAQSGVSWQWSATRALDLPSLLFANAWEPAGLLLVAAMAGAMALTRPRISRDPARWSVVVVAAVLYFFGPGGAFGTAYLYPRFAFFLVVGLLVLFERAVVPSMRVLLIARAIVILVVIGWMSVLGERFSRFGEEAQEFESLVTSIPANRRVAQFNILPFSEHVPGPVFWHFGALAQVRRGGVAAWSFARHYPAVVRFRKGREPVVKTESTPVDGIDWPGVLEYDYLLVRGPDARRFAFRGAPVPIALRARSGSWWLYETPHARLPQRDCVPLNE